MSDSDRQTGRGYPLSVLFLFVTICAAMIAMIALLARPRGSGEIDVAEAAKLAIRAGIICGVVLLVVGVFVGCFHARRLRTIMYGAATGFILGLFAGPVLLLPSDEFPFLLLTSMTGAAAILFVAMAIRLTTNYHRPDFRAGHQRNGTEERRPHPLDSHT